MTSGVDDSKTNEFLRRRKLRLQQVREQSKDIAKKIRQRAKVENLRQVIELDSKKKKEYLQRQEQLVKKLEEYYAAGLQNVGSSHRNATEVQLQGADGDKVDLSKQRGREAAAQLRKKRQQILDKQKEFLDRKLQAREVANEISRDKSGAAIIKPLPNSTNTILDKPQSKTIVAETDYVDKTKKDSDVARTDMATQWDLDEIPNEWEPNIPTLLLPNDDNSVKETNNNNVDSKSDKSKRMDLFAVSEEMPSSLCGGLTNQEDKVPFKSSLTLVSEYLQNRDLRLRETDTTRTNKKPEEFHSLKQTILRTRTSKEGTVNACHVHDGEMVPVPSWQAEHSNCAFCPCTTVLHNKYNRTAVTELKTHSGPFRPKSTGSNLPKQFEGSQKPAHYSPHSKLFDIETLAHPDALLSPVLRGTSPFRRSKASSRSFSAKGDVIDKLSKSNKYSEDNINPRKSLVTMYNHNTRDSRDIPCCDERLVVRNSQDADDAYSQAMKESSTSHSQDKDHQKKVQEIRSKVAMTKKNVEKEYKDTISFLNALPKDKGNKPIKTAYMDEHRQQTQKDNRQQKLQQEYRKIEKECSKHNCKKKITRKSCSPAMNDSDVFESTDMQYSWMPVPESDGNLAIHTIPTTLREGKSNTVKFSKVDSYHEYRSRHKHTPPTKDTADRPRNNDVVDASDIQDTSDVESFSSGSSVQSVRLVKKDKSLGKKEGSDAERIIIYKILDGKDEERKKTSKLMKNIAKSLTRIEQQTKIDEELKKSDAKKSSSNNNADNIVSFEQLDEGVYESVNENGDNIASMYFHDKEAQVTEEQNASKCCTNCKKRSKPSHKVPAPQQWDAGDELQERSGTGCNCSCKSVPPKVKSSMGQQSIATSATSFLTAANDKASSAASDGGFIKLIDEGGREAGKFYIGASGLLKNDAYEVVIQLRKKGDEKETSNKTPEDKKDEALGMDKVTVVSSTQTSLRDIYEGSGNKSEAAGTSAVAIPQTNKVLQTEPESYRSLTDRFSRQTIFSDDFPQPSENVQANETVESKEANKGESIVNDNINVQSVLEPQPAPARPATSTYTQTTLNSPNHRPILFHMSSSTSTAYMSPPDMILPKFMRPDYQITDDDMYDRRNFIADEIMMEQHEFSEEVHCSCRKCKHAKRLTQTKRGSNHRCKSVRNPKTPPNTAGSTRSEGIDHIYFDEENVGAKQKPTYASRKCASHTHNHDDTESLRRKKSRHSAPSKLSSRNLTLRIPSSTPSSRKGQMTSKISKTCLKPVIKNYVDKLLELNKESLKAVQIVDQDCSEVTTPGSSVINIPNNISKHKLNVENKLSLEKIRDILKQKIIDENGKSEYKIDEDKNKQNAQMCYRVQSSKNVKHPKIPRKKTAHKVKSLNISKKMSRVQTSYDSQTTQNKPLYSSSSTKAGCVKHSTSAPSRNKVRSKSSPTPRLPPNSDTTDRSGNSDIPHTKFNIPKFRSKLYKNSKSTNLNERKFESLHMSGSSNHAMTTTSNDSDRNAPSTKHNTEVPMSISTQTSINVDSEVNYMKLAEDKLQNMEKIADLTEKCTKRLSNLAKVLEEVRKNKTLVYSHISTSDVNSDSDQNSDKNANNVTPAQEPSNNESKKTELNSPDLTKGNASKDVDNSLNSTGYIPFLSNIPKPVAFKSLNSDFSINSSSSSSRKSNSSPVNENIDQSNKHRAKPPPALSRIHLKHGQDFVVPHELSTVVEVDSPMSIKLKSSRNETKTDAPEANNHGKEIGNDHHHSPLVELNMGDANNPDLLDNNTSNEQHKKSAMKWSDSMESSKVQMIDLEQFNEIMLKPFFSLQEYAKQCNVATLDDGSNLDDILKDDHINDELSSLHSEASLPDVISELLKRNIISEPFKFDSGSNANSTTLSSESTISVLALSRARHGPRKSNIFKNKDNIGETSDTMSISSNPDLENAFKKLGMGWASSTLKKTKERLALSSSSNTSSSSLSQFRVKSFNPDIPEPVTDTVSSLLSLPNNLQQRNAADKSKNAEQQTSKTNAMTVKEFLTNELAKKITFNNKSKNDTVEEFASLYETKMPEEMKRSSLMVREENRSIDTSGNNNRARTSTPVQLYKSMTYHSSSSSNMSNGLFSNADDLSSVKVTSTSMKHSTSDKDDLVIPNFSLRMKKGSSDCSKSD